MPSIKEHFKVVCSTSDGAKDQIVLIDVDQGLSGKQAAGRERFSASGRRRQHGKDRPDHWHRGFTTRRAFNCSRLRHRLLGCALGFSTRSSPTLTASIILVTSMTRLLLGLKGTLSRRLSFIAFASGWTQDGSRKRAAASCYNNSRRVTSATPPGLLRLILIKACENESVWCSPNSESWAATQQQVLQLIWRGALKLPRRRRHQGSTPGGCCGRNPTPGNCARF